jgi:hypothetical protein
MSQDQRNAFRINMPDGQKRAALRIQGNKVDVQLLDASATGVAIACPLNCTLEINDNCELHTPSGGGQIRIVRKEIFPDGILLGAVRTGDLKEGPRNILAHAKEFVSFFIRLLTGLSLPARIGAVAAVFALLLVVTILICSQFKGGQHLPHVRAQVSPTPVGGQTSMPTEVRDALRNIEATLPHLAPPELSESDLRAKRIFDQQKQLLEPEFSKRLRLTPFQESRIQRALQPAEELESDATNPLFWDAIRRSETQILTILTPVQVKVWRQQSGT